MPVVATTRWATLAALCLALCVVHPRPASAQDKVDYLRDIKPILHEKCFSCHGGLKQKAKLRLDTAALIKQGGKNGPAIVPGDPSKSLLVQRVIAPENDGRMPLDAPPLTAAQLAKLKAWIAEGASGPVKEEAERDPRDHWAFRVIERPKVPSGKDPAWAKNPIDAFLAAEHARRGLTPRPPAERSLLLRRVYLDLIGLPPTPEQLRAFLADESADAYEKAVAKLLDSPQYGERWARHWMDVWRYSDWYGRRMVPDVWNSAPQIWRWRDWIVKSLNDDKGYARMLQEMIAADEICPEDTEAAVATGYLVRNWYALNPNDWMRANVEHTGKGFLGLTFNCAHCHDHKYDPISHDDYFRFRAFFETIGIRQERIAGEADPGVFQEYDYSVLRKIQRVGMVRIYDKSATAPTWFYTGGDERNRVKEKGSLAPGLPAFLGNVSVKPLDLPAAAFYPGLRPAIVEATLRERQAALAKAEAELAVVRKSVEAALPQLRTQLKKNEADFAQVEAISIKTDAAQAPQALILDATNGRRILHNNLPGLRTLADGTLVRFEFQIVRDAHFNFQLGKDTVKGLTAAMVAFDKGTISAYEPGGFKEFAAGKYDLAAGQNRFEVSLVVQTKADRCLLTVTSKKDSKKLVDAVPVALNGWNPVGDPVKAIMLDARTGSVVRIDEIALIGPGVKQGGAGERRFNFQSYPVGRDVVGIDGWSAHSFSVAPATSLIARNVVSPKLREADQKLRLSRRAVEAQEWHIKAAEARVTAGKLERASFEARLVADRAKYGDIKNADVAQLSRAAALAERDAAAKSAEANVCALEQALATAEAKPAGDPKREKEIAVIAQQLTAGRIVFEKAQAKLHEPPAAYSPLGPLFPAKSTGRRKALAAWLADRDNPLTARVAVNHIWMRHFHAPLVATVSDFGRNGAAPSHPELLDWLAVELMEKNWSMKHLHRLIVTSQAYRMTSAAGPAGGNAKLDPENKYLWRMNAGRMEAEVVRDSLLACAGQLDLTMGGQEIENAQALTTRRRSLYYSCYPEDGGKNAIGALFDAPEPGECYRRTRTVLPQQALALTNSDLVHSLSAELAKSLSASLPPKDQASPQAFVAAAYERILCRVPSTAELKACTDFLQPPPPQAPEAGMRAPESLVRALLNHNDFVTIR